MGSKVSGKKISSLIKRYSGNSERERRAYEEEPEKRNTGKDFLSDKVENLTRKFKYGDFVFSYYRYLDRFKTEPDSMKALYEFIEYSNVDGEIQATIKELSKVE